MTRAAPPRRFPHQRHSASNSWPSRNTFGRSRRLGSPAHSTVATGLPGVHRAAAQPAARTASAPRGWEGPAPRRPGRAVPCPWPWRSRIGTTNGLRLGIASPAPARRRPRSRDAKPGALNATDRVGGPLAQQLAARPWFGPRPRRHARERVRRAPRLRERLRASAARRTSRCSAKVEDPGHLRSPRFSVDCQTSSWACAAGRPRSADGQSRRGGFEAVAAQPGATAAASMPRPQGRPPLQLLRRHDALERGVSAPSLTLSAITRRQGRRRTSAPAPRSHAPPSPGYPRPRS